MTAVTTVMPFRDDDRHPIAGDPERQLRECQGETHTAVGSRVSRQLSCTQSHYISGETVHVRHRRVVVGR